MKADFKIHRVVEDKEALYGTQCWMIELLRNEGATFFRMTLINNVLILEGWKVQPEDQGPEPKLEDIIGFGT